MIRCALALTLRPADVDAAAAQAVDLVGQHARVDDDAVADHAGLARVEDPARDQVEASTSRPSRTIVWPALLPPWKRTTMSALLGEQVDDLALALVAPLGADDHDARHAQRSLGCAADVGVVRRRSSRASSP